LHAPEAARGAANPPAPTYQQLSDRLATLMGRWEAGIRAAAGHSVGSRFKAEATQVKRSHFTATWRHLELAQ